MRVNCEPSHWVTTLGFGLSMQTLMCMCLLHNVSVMTVFFFQPLRCNIKTKTYLDLSVSAPLTAVWMHCMCFVLYFSTFFSCMIFAHSLPWPLSYSWGPLIVSFTDYKNKFHLPTVKRVVVVSVYHQSAPVPHTSCWWAAGFLTQCITRNHDLQAALEPVKKIILIFFKPL